MIIHIKQTLNDSILQCYNVLCHIINCFVMKLIWRLTVPYWCHVWPYTSRTIQFLIQLFILKYYSSEARFLQHLIQHSGICRLIIWQYNPSSFAVAFTCVFMRGIFEFQICFGHEIDNFITFWHFIIKLKANKSYVWIYSNLHINRLICFICIFDFVVCCYWTYN